MVEGDDPAPVLLVIDPDGALTAERLGAAFPEMHRPPGTDSDPGAVGEEGLGALLCDLYRKGQPLVVLGETDRLLHALAPLLVEQGPGEATPVVAVAGDGSAVIPLVGAARGADDLARRVGAVLGVSPAYTRARSRAEPAPDDPPRPPGRGRLAVVGLGPGSAALMAPTVREELSRAQDVVGYATYLRLVGDLRQDQRIHASDNRCEMERARAAFDLAAEGRRVVVVSSGDPGVFAMATAVLETLHRSEEPSWHAVELLILPGISAAQAAAARVGAPLGHDFCVISLSDNLKPWGQIETRLDQAAAADFVIALYNPSSRARPWQLARALELVRRHRAPPTPVVLGRDLGRPGERVLITNLAEVRPEQVDMRTLVILGSSQTRQFPRPGGGSWVYTPRWYPDTTEPV